MALRKYKIIEKPGSITVKDVYNFNPVHIFECGQCFRWEREDDGSYTGVAMGRVINVLAQNRDLIIRNTGMQDFENIWYEYFDLGRDYSQIMESVSVDDVMEKAVEYGAGIRLLKQDFFETLISFIISANNTIPRIAKIVKNLSLMYGDKIIWGDREYYTFPVASRLAHATPEELSECRGGYRCRYIRETSAALNREDVDIFHLSKADVAQARSTLLKLCGVGNKVADCILLYSGRRYDVFPTDVWVRRVMESLYLKRQATMREISEFASARFGGLAGFAQQYLFYYAREKKIGVQNKG